VALERSRCLPEVDHWRLLKGQAVRPSNMEELWRPTFKYDEHKLGGYMIRLRLMDLVIRRYEYFNRKRAA
jgi:hypothetical protein